MSAFGGARLDTRCDVRPPFQPNVKFLVVYPLPWYGIQTGAAFQSIPGPQITASYTASNAQIAPSLGRLSSGVNGTATIDLIAPATINERLNQLDLRVSKIFKLPAAHVGQHGRLRARTSAILGQNNAYGAIWQKPSSILQARFSAQCAIAVLTTQFRCHPAATNTKPKCTKVCAFVAFQVDPPKSITVAGAGCFRRDAARRFEDRKPHVLVRPRSPTVNPRPMSVALAASMLGRAMCWMARSALGAVDSPPLPATSSHIAVANAIELSLSLVRSPIIRWAVRVA
jgi:hypothetical protein